VIVEASYKRWPLVLPQHGPGRKHHRPIVLADWPRAIVDRHPRPFLRGLINSDGCRTNNRFKTTLPSGRVAEYAYPRDFLLQPVRRHPRPVLRVLRAARDSLDPVEPAQHLGVSPRQRRAPRRVRGAEAMTPGEYIAGLDEPRRGEIERLHGLIRETLPELEPHVASGMLAYGRYHYHDASGREGDASQISLASRKAYISLDVACVVDGADLAEGYAERRPKANIGKSCVRFKRTDDVDLDTARELVAEAARIGPAGAA
jgi:hypothetical protein